MLMDTTNLKLDGLTNTQHKEILTRLADELMLIDLSKLLDKYRYLLHANLMTLKAMPAIDKTGLLLCILLFLCCICSRRQGIFG